MRKASLIALLAASLTGCGLVPGVFVAQGTASPRAVPPTTTPLTPMTSPSPSSAGARLTVAGARKAVASWVARHNATIKDRDWWDDPDTRDGLFADGTRHHVVLDRGHVEDGDKSKARKPIRLVGRQTYYVPREQPADGEWFLLQATYRGQDRPSVLTFRRLDGERFKLAAFTPLHHGSRIPAPLLDSDGLVTSASAVNGTSIARTYLNFWNGDEKAGKQHYRLAKDNFSRRAHAVISKGIYAGFRSATQAYGFHTEDGGAFYVFSLLNNPQSIWQVLTVGVSVPRNGREIREIGGDWYA